MAKKPVPNTSPTIKNRRASHDYELRDRYEAGVMLTGTEVKALRQGKANLQDSFCSFQGSDLVLVNAEISHYNQGNVHNHNPRRPRKLLLRKQELRKLRSQVQEKGFTLVPTKLYFNERNLAKLEFALARGKKTFDKRQSLKEKDQKREADRAMRRLD